MRTSRLVPLLLMLLWPVAALACPVCFNAREESRHAFLWTAIAMTLLPLSLIGGLGYWLWRRVRADAAPAAEDEQ